MMVHRSDLRWLFKRLWRDLVLVLRHPHAVMDAMMEVLTAARLLVANSQPELGGDMANVPRTHWETLESAVIRLDQARQAQKGGPASDG